ncbi:MAG TPA: HAD family phosphatase [Armatimonadota bacterium]|nr:HAD family phosphatase [Armatimonadota bacterium]
MAKIEVLVSDLGKVLLPFEVERVWRALNPHFGVSHEEARQVVRSLFRETQFGTGGATGQEFHARLVERAGLALPYEAFCTAWSDMFWEDEAVLRLIAEAPVAKRYLLSNTNDIHWRFIQERYPHVLAPFDRLAVSHELGLEKPDAAIYEWVVRDSGYPPAAHLFIDDIAENVEGARAAGMDAILHTDSESLWREFVARGLATEAQRPERTEVVVATPPERAMWAATEEEPAAKRNP